MKKWIIYSSYALNAILIIALVISISDDEAVPFNPSKYTQQNLEKSLDVANNMATEDVRKIMGAPVKREITKSVEEWHYCRTGEVVDEYVAIEFYEGKVTKLSHYTVSALDLVYHHTATPNAELTSFMEYGDCKLFIRWGTYGEKTPNKKIQPTPKNGAAD